MSRSARTTLITLSVLGILNAMFIPMIDTWSEYDFFKAVELIFEDSDAWGMGFVQIIMMIFIPAALMFIAALTGSRGFFIACNAFGLTLASLLIITESDRLDIGAWIALVLFIITFVIALTGKERVGTRTPTYYNPSQPRQSPTCNTGASGIYGNVDAAEGAGGSIDPVVFSTTGCPKCGAISAPGTQYCLRCGYGYKR